MTQKLIILFSDVKNVIQTTRVWMLNKNGASAGNRTRVTSMATRYSTTRPQMLHSFRTFRIDIVNGIDFKLRGIFIY
ncbi:conserved hypothetical protein [Theileria orientalis strain Shintoku]|uniref:Uncharacterized protein n=1 Tax=Theileria orientalis strain Shintoku TaxID=869250 RepID=J4CE34_THEOR|nr:conserved hypothetical protein [Theileria orientalis strain Shintoku]BAM42197.1 conserved hypothetical protein [Theileria orientalis strain Shintoku]|eukprot:XP_009692498.1 conserved hypothetical protein [Theileria orientalis strain Shintoku]